MQIQLLRPKKVDNNRLNLRYLAEHPEEFEKISMDELFEMAEIDTDKQKKQTA